MTPIATKNFSINFIFQPNLISEKIVSYLTLLDLMLIIQKGYDFMFKVHVNRLKLLIQELSYEEWKVMTQFARKYPVSVRALLGILLAEMNHPTLSLKVLQTLDLVILRRYKKKYLTQ